MLVGAVPIQEGERVCVIASGGNLALGYRIGANKEFVVDPAGAQIVRVRGQSDAAAPPPAAMEALPPAEKEMSSDDDGFGENWVRDDGGE